MPNAARMVHDAFLFHAFAETLRAAMADDASPASCFSEIDRTWRPIASLLGIAEEHELCVIDPLRTAVRSYEHDQALCRWATGARDQLSADTSVAALRCVAETLPIPHVHRMRLNPKTLGPLTRQLDLFTPPSRSG